jgi:hypothetical protein
MNRSDKRLLRIAAVAGMTCPLLFAAALVALTALQYDFMLSLGWRPLAHPTLDWPSGLALGPYGALMTAVFIVCGLGMGLFGIGMRRALGEGSAVRRASLLISLGGLAMVLLASPTHPTLSTAPMPFTGYLHDAAFVLLGLTLFPAMLIYVRVFRQVPAWRGLSGYTLFTAALAIPTFALKGAAFYLFLAAILAWSEIVAVRLYRV